MQLRDRRENRAHGGGEPASAKGYFSEITKVIPLLPYAALDAIVYALLRAFAEDRMVFVFGNGGSAASASHMMVDLNKGVAESGFQRPKVMALTDNVPLLTAWANDSSYDHVFSEQLKSFVRKKDVAFAISASGNSTNVLLALRVARQRGATTLGVAGHDGGKMKPLCDICAVVPSRSVPVIEDMHHAMLHAIFTAVRENLRAVQPWAIATAAARWQK